MVLCLSLPQMEMFMFACLPATCMAQFSRAADWYWATDQGLGTPGLLHVYTDHLYYQTSLTSKKGKPQKLF